MRKFVRSGLKSVLVALRPIDQKLRETPKYSNLSDRLERAYRSSPLFDGGANVAPDRRRYFDLYDRIDVDPKLVVLDSFWGRNVSGNPLAVFLEMHRRPEFADHRFVWVKNDGVSAPSWMSDDPRTTFVSYRSSEHVDALLGARVLVGNSNLPGYFTRKPDQEYVNLWHGTPLKRMGADIDQPVRNVFNTQRNFTQSTLICLPSDYAIDKTVRPYGDVGATRRAHVTGSPRVDLQLSADRDEIRRQLGIPDGRGVILYAPTWRGAVGSVETAMDRQLEAVDALAREFGDTHEILLSIHNYTQSNLVDRPTGCSLVPDDLAINLVLAATDILITDYSSIFFDFLRFDRPTILYAYDLETYKRQRGLYLDLAELPVTVVRSLGDLISVVGAPTKPSEADVFEDAMQRFLPLEDGSASTRVVDLILAGSAVSDYRTSGRTRMLIHPGHLKRNGITTAFLNLIDALDHDRFDVYVIVDSSAFSRAQVHPRAYERIRARCTIVLKSEATYVSNADLGEYRAWNGGYSLEDLSSPVQRSLEIETRRILSDTHFDVSVNYSGYSVWWSQFMGLVNADRHVVYQHNDLHEELVNPQRDQAQLSRVFRQYSLYDRVVAVSPVLRDINQKNLGRYYPTDGLATFARNLVEPDQIRRDARQILSLPDPMKSFMSFEQSVLSERSRDERIVRFVTSGRLSAEKNHKRLIRGFKAVRESGVSAVLFIMGEGPLEAELKALVSRLDLTGEVVFLGQVENPFAVIEVCDCFVLSSDYEGQPMVLLEALALDKHIIATDVPTISYVVEGHGDIVARTPRAMADAMIRFAQSPPATKSFDFDRYRKEAIHEFELAIS